MSVIVTVTVSATLYESASNDAVPECVKTSVWSACGVETPSESLSDTCILGASTPVRSPVIIIVTESDKCVRLGQSPY